jgi:RNA-directed DNA polymerase
MELRRDGYNFTFETDIQRFFPSIDRDFLQQELRRKLPDNSLDDLIDAAIDTSVSNIDALEARGLSECWDPQVGVPQGGVLSPLLANFYLASFDRDVNSQDFQMVRYVDDLVILTRTKDEAAKAFEFCKRRLAALGLTIHDLDEINEKGKTKTRIVDRNQPFDFLGLTFYKRSIQPAKSKLKDLEDRIRGAAHARTGRKTLVDLVVGLNRLLRGWMAAYAMCDIPTELVTRIDHIARTGLASWMTYHGLVRSPNAIDFKLQAKIGLWSAKHAEIRPISKLVFTSVDRQPCNKLVAQRNSD